MSHICTFKSSSSHIKKPKKKQVRLILVIYLTQYYLKYYHFDMSLIYFKILMRYFTFILSSKSNVYFTLTAHLSSG